jgi:hypothetical protein
MDTSVNPDVDAFAAEAESASNVKTVVNTVDADARPAVNPDKFYTEVDLARVRSQEKDKLYPQIDNLKEQLDALKRERQEELSAKVAEQAALEAQLAEEAKRKQEEELEVRDLLKVKEQEWEQRLGTEREERERAFALLDRERTFAEIQSYRNSRLEEERDNILPELVDMINGNTQEEIESSIQGLKTKSSSIMDNVQQATQAARRDMAGTRVTTPPNAGPPDIDTGTKQFTAEEIANMPLNDYAKYRSQLLSPAAQGRSKGLFG